MAALILNCLTFGYFLRIRTLYLTLNTILILIVQSYLKYFRIEIYIHGTERWGNMENNQKYIYDLILRFTQTFAQIVLLCQVFQTFSRTFATKV